MECRPAPCRGESFRCSFSVMEQPDAAERHGNAVLVAGVNDLLVPDGAAGLDDGRHAGAAGALDVVAEGEERVRAQADARDMASGTLSSPRRVSGSGCSVKVSAQTPSPMTSSAVVADVNVDGVVPVGLGRHRRGRAGSAPCACGAAASCRPSGRPDGCSGCGSAGRRPRRWSGRRRRSRRELDWVYFRVMRAMMQVPLLLLGHGLVLGDPVGEHGVGVDGQLVAALLKGDAVHLLVLHGAGLVVRVDGDHVVVALASCRQGSPALPARSPGR